MNQNRAQRYTTTLLALLGLLLGFTAGLLVDQAANVQFNGALLPAFKACRNCLEAGVPLLAEAIKVNAWTLLGAIAGLTLGLVAAWVMASGAKRAAQPFGQPKRLSGMRQAAELARFSRTLGDTLDLQSILTRLHEEALRVTSADCGSSFLLDPESPEHRVTLRVGEGAELHRFSPMEAAAVASGRSRIVQDFEVEGEAPPHVGVRSALLVPITHEENAIGLIHIHSQQPSAFDAEFHDLVQALAAQAAVAIQNAQRYGEQSRRSEGLRQRVNQLQKLSQIPNTVRIDRPLTANLQSIAQTMRETADFSLVLISVFASAGNQLVHTAAAGLAPETFESLQHLPLPWERLQPFLREENRNNRVYRVPHTHTADLYQALDLGQVKKPAEPRAPGQWHPDDMLLVPLYGSRGEIEGLLSVGAPRDVQTPPSLVLEMLEIFASQAALAIENAQMLTQAEERVSESQERAVQLSVLTEAAAVIATALRVDEVVTLALDQLRRVIPYDTATFWQSELSDRRWRVLGARSYQDAIERVVSRSEQAQATVFSEIIATRSVVCVPDVSRDARFSAKEASSMRSWLGVPVISNGEVTAIVALEKAEDNFYSAAQVPLALSFANRIAAALDNARLYEESVQRTHELETESAHRAHDVELRSQRLTLVNRIATGLTQAHDLKEVLLLTLETLAGALDVERANGFILDGETALDSARVLASARLPVGEPGAAALVLANNPLLERLQENGSPLLAQATDRPAETVVRPEHLAWIGSEVCAAIFLPLIADGRLLGVIGLGGIGERKFTQAEAELGRAVALQTVTAVQYLQLRDRAQEQAAVQHLARAIGLAGDFGELCQVIRAQLAEVAGIHSLSLALYSEPRNRVSFPLIVERGEVLNAGDGPAERTPGGMVGYVLQNRHLLRLTGDVAAQAKALGIELIVTGQHPVRGGPETGAAQLAKAYLAVPLLVGEKLVGALIAEDAERPDALDDRAERLLTASANQIAVAVDNLRLHEQARQSLAESQERATQFETLTEAAVALSSTLRTDEVIAAALEQLGRLVPFDRATYWQRVDGAQPRRGATAQWQATAMRGYPAANEQLGLTIEVGPRSPLGDVLAARRAVAISNTGGDSRFTGPAGSWMAVPLLQQNDVIGLLELEKAGFDAFGPAQLTLAQSLAARIALALDNARQYEASLQERHALDEQTRRLATTSRAAATLAGTLDLGEVLSATLRLVAEAAAVERAGVLVYNEESTQLLRTERLPASSTGSASLLPAAADGAAIMARLREAGAALTLEELTASRLLAPEQTEWVGGGVLSGLFVRLAFNGQTLGLLGLGQAQAGRTFTTTEIETLRDLARLAGAAIYEARQYQTAQERLSEQVVVNQISRAISQALDIRQLSKLLHTQLDAWLAPAHLWLALYDEARHEVSFPLAVADGQTITLTPRAPDAVLRHVLQTQQPLLLAGGQVLSQQLEALSLPPEALAPAHSYLGAPLVLGAAEGARVLGVLALADPARAPVLTESHQRVLAALATQVAISLDNARLYAAGVARMLELDERAQRLAWLNHTAAELGSGLELGPILQVALRALTQLLPADRASAVLFDDSLDTASLLARLPAADDQPTPPAWPLAGHSFFERLLPRLRESPAPVAFDDLAADPALAPDQLAWLGPDLHSALIFPLELSGRPLGLMALGRAATGEKWLTDQTDLAQSLVGQTALAIANARLYRRTEQRLTGENERIRSELNEGFAKMQRRLSEQYQTAQERLGEQLVVNQISRGLSRTLDLRQLLDSLRAQMEAWVGPAGLTLALFDEARHEVSFPLVVVDGQERVIGPGAPDGVLRHILETQQPLMLNGREQLAEALLGEGLADPTLASVQAFLGVPLVLADRIVGALTLTDPGRVPQFEERHQRSLVTLASQLAATIENARLHEMARQAMVAAQVRSAQLSTLTEALGVITSALSVEEVMELALSQLQLLAPYARATFWQRVPGGEDEWHPAASRAAPTDGGRALSPAALPPALASYIANSRGSALVPDVRNDARFPGNGARAAAAWLGVPVVSQGIVAAILVLESAEPDGYHSAQVPLVQSFAQQTAAALDNARRYEDSLQRAQDFERRGALLTRAALDLSGTLDLTALLPVALRTLADALSASQGGVLIFAPQAGPADPATPPLVLAWAQFPPVSAEQAAPVLANNSLFERLRDARDPVVVDDSSRSRPVAAEQATWTGGALQSAAFFPLLAAERRLGVIGIGHISAHTFGATELELGQALANQAAAAIANALLYSDLQQRLNEQIAVNQVIRSLNRAGNLQQLTEIVRGRIGSWVTSDNLYLALYDEARNEISLPLLVEGGRPRQVPPFAPGGVLRQILQTRHTLRLSGDINTQCRELGIPISFISHRPQRWTEAAGEALTAQSYLGVPILFGEKVLGALVVEANVRPDAFDEHHERILRTLAAQIALVMDTYQLSEQSRRALAAAQERVAQLEALAAALSVIASALYSEDVVGIALDQFQRVIAYDRAAFWRREVGGGAARDTRWRAAGARGYSENLDRLSQMAVASGSQAALFAEIVSTRRILLVADATRDSRFSPGLEWTTGSWLGVPLVNKGEVIGLLVAEKVEPGFYHAGNTSPALILANQITAVLTNTFQYEESVQRVLELDERSRRLAFLNRFSAELGANLNLSSILQLTLKALAESLGVDQATAAVFDDARSAVLALEHYPDVRGGPAGAGRLALPGNFLIERLQETPAPITVEDLTAPETHARLRQADWIGQEVRAAMFLPLVTAGKLIGLIGLGQSAAGRRFTPGEMELGMALANQAGVAAQNARLYDRTQQRLAEQSSINQINRAVGKSLDPHGLFAIVHEQIEAWVGANRLYLALYDEGRNEVSFPLAIEGNQPVLIEPRAPTGLVWHLLQQPEPVRLNGDITQQLKDMGLYVTGLGAAIGLDDAASITSYLGVPLISDNHPMGALILANPRRAEVFDESHERILSAVAAQLAAALSQARQFEQTRQITLATQTRASQLSVLSEAASAIATALRTEQVIALTLDQLQRVIPYDSARLWRRDGIEGPWRVAAERGAIGEDGGQLGQASDLALPEHDPVAEVLSTRASLVIPDARSDGRFESLAKTPGSWLGLPLIYQGDVLAVLAIEKSEPNTYSLGLAPLAQAFAHQAAVTLGNVQRYEDSLRRAFELDERAALLNRVSAELSRALEPHEVLRTTLAALAEAMHLDRAAAVLFDESQTTGRVRTTVHLPSTDEANARTLPLTSNLLLDQLRDNLAPVMAADVSGDSLILPAYATWIGPDVKSVLFVPLAVAGKLAGVVGLGHTGRQPPFTAGEIELAVNLCNQAAVSANNARLYQETQRRLMELATITQSSRTIGRTIDLKQVFATVRAQLEANVPAHSYYVALFDETKNEVIYPLAVEHSEEIEIGARPPDRLIRHILDSRQTLLLAGDVEAKLAELGLKSAASTDAILRARCYLGVPLLLGNRATGVLAVEDYERSFAFNERHERMILDIAAPIAAAVDEARLYAELEQRGLALDSRAALLGRLSAELSETTSLASIVRLTAQVAAETLMVDVAAALVLDEVPGALVPLASAHYPDDAAAQRPAFVTAGNVLLNKLQTTLAPVALDDLTTDSEAKAELTVWLGQNITTALFLPLITADKLIGLVAVGQTGGSRQFTAGEVDLARSLANQVAIAATNARLHEKMQPRLLELAAITRICQAIGRVTSLAQLCDTLVTEVGKALEAETIVLALFDAASEAVSFPLVFAGGQWHSASPQAPAGPLAYIIQSRRPLRLNGQIEAQLHELGAAYQPLLAGRGAPQSFLGVPLLLNGRVIGVMAVEDEKVVGKFNESHESILTTVAAPMAVAVENARLQAERDVRASELAERTTQLALLNRLSAALIGSLEVEPILCLTLDELRASLAVDQAGGLLLDATGGLPASAVVAPAASGQPGPEALADLVQALSAEKGPLVIANVDNGQHVRSEHLAWLGSSVRTLLLLPMLVNERLAGLIWLARDAAGRPFAATEIGLAATCVNQAASAVASARLFEAARQSQQTALAQSAQFVELTDISNSLAAATTTSAVVAATLAALSRALPYDSLSFYRYRPAQTGTPGQLIVIGTAGPAGATLGQTLDLGAEPFLADLLRGHTPVVVRDANSQARMLGNPAQSARAAGSGLGIPLTQGDQAAGLIVIAKAEPDFYQAGHVATAQAIAGQVAAALDQTEQLEATNERARTLEAALQEQSTYNRIARALNQVGDLDQIISVLTAEFSQLADVEAWYLVLRAAGADKVAFAALVENGQSRAVKPAPPEGVIQYILQHGQPLQLAGDIGARLKELGLPHRGSRARIEAGDPSAAQAYLGVPLTVNERAIGVLAIENDKRADAFVERHLRLTQAIAELLATAVERVHWREQSEQSGRQLSEFRGLYEQSSQSTEGLVRQLSEQTAALAHLQAQQSDTAREAQELQGRLRRQDEVVQGVRERLETWRGNRKQPSASRVLDSVLSQELLIGSRALGAEAGAVYLWQPASKRLANRFVYGLAEALPAGVDHEAGLVAAVLQSRQPIVVGDLTTDPRWIGPAHSAEGLTAAGTGTNGATAEHEATLETHAPGATNGYYRSALVMPLLADEQVLGAVLFLSARRQAFDEAILPVAWATASQIAFAIQTATQDAALRQQIEAMQQLISGGPGSAGVPVTPAGGARPRPTLPPVEQRQALPEPVRPAAVEQVAASAPTGWRRLALPAAALVVIVCLAAAAIGNAGTIRQAASALFGGAAATSLGPTALVAPPAATLAQTNAGATSATTTPAPGSALPLVTATPGATTTATATPKPTNTAFPSSTPLPSATATAPLPADVVAVARVVLPDGVVGRLRDGPNGNVVGGVPGNTLVHVLRGRQTTSDGLAWVPIRMPDTGQSGWFAESLLKYMATPMP